ncbi:mechanosensitive ion channel family protein [Pseudoduganella umbonata]|uniref:Mechanosensitive ion channel family protein n=1 Tax=Pseudoduganella umbonata TaxID=864828 RepID=A0A4P8HN83_9BURK|nr:mechanosensitive ion channel family protein [Pseudoduganella umbonata]MBB3221330.1 small-conductance mechanosensitive channel [Pseudoduganella umbonata]QCP10496.1 mechanosensitive ion channel family protein [Pseudoduganella umbonata]
MDYVVLGNDLNTWMIAIGIAAAVSMALYGANRFLVRRIGAFADHTATHVDDMAVRVLKTTSTAFIVAMGIYAGTQWLLLSPKAETLLRNLAVAILLLQIARWLDVGVRGWIDFYRKKRGATDVAATTSTAALTFVARAALWAVILLMILDNFGVNITTLVASLGIGGIAVALAVQNILGDLFSSLSILLDKPFVVGDFITVDDLAGTVQYVGLKTTRIRSLNGEEIVFSNSDLLKSRIHNVRRMETRRVVFSVGVTYDITEEQLESIPGTLKEIVSAQPQAKFDRAHFKGFGASSLDFEVVYVMQTPDYGLFMDTQQAINFALFKRFNRAGIEFAYPTQTVKLSNPEVLRGEAANETYEGNEERRRPAPEPQPKSQ